MANRLAKSMMILLTEHGTEAVLLALATTLEGFANLPAPRPFPEVDDSWKKLATDIRLALRRHIQRIEPKA